MTDLLAYATELPLLSVAPGETLIEEGTSPGRMFVLQEGAVVIEHDGVPFARIDTPGAVFGEMAWVLEKPATATVRAVGEVEVRVVDDPMLFFTDAPGAALTVLRTTASRLDGLTQYLVDVKQQFGGEDGHLGMVGQILDHLVHHQGPSARTGSARDPEGDHPHDHE
ncbi:CRP/FNR family transcriptional regulator, cyclic AMP receptor protein [Marmoricola sp. URHA0025 HA25]